MILKIIGGKYKARFLRTKEIIGTRPLKQNIKVTIYDIIANKIVNTNVIDLFAGFGTFGVEALSRGAKYVHFNDTSYKCIKEIYKWIEKLQIEKKQYHVTKFDASKLIKFNNWQQTYDYIYFDPPFALSKVDKILKNLLNSKLLAKQAIIIWRTHKSNKIDLEIQSKIWKKRIIGINAIYFLSADSI